jgi:hypothetical protein
VMEGGSKRERKLALCETAHRPSETDSSPCWWQQTATEVFLDFTLPWKRGRENDREKISTQASTARCLLEASTVSTLKTNSLQLQPRKRLTVTAPRPGVFFLQSSV